MGLAEWTLETVANARNHSPKFAVRHAAHTLYLGGVRRLSPLFSSGADFWDEDWEVLLILDACRPDLMREACEVGNYEWLPESEELETVRSPASTSHEWMESHFSSEHADEMESTAYVTANLFIQDYDFEQFGAFSQLTAEPVDGIQVTIPRRLTDRAIDIWRRRNELGVERMIIHYMQPHTPFRSKPSWFDGEEPLTGWGNGFVQLRDGLLSYDEFWAAYFDNLQWVLDDVDLLTTNCDADMVVTSDHGNGLGELGIYGHPNGIPFDVVREVPWVPISGRDEAEYEPELPDGYLRSEHGIASEELSDHLNALGYV